MRKVILIATVVIAMVAVALSLVSLYHASRQVPVFYIEAIAQDAGEQEEARDEFVASVAGLASDLHRRGKWQALFTEKQINAWLALELVGNDPNLLPSELADPRVSIRAREATIACRYTNGGVTTVLSLTADMYLKTSNVLAVRIRRVRAGTLPVPLTQVLNAISQAARGLKLRLEWRKTQGDPVALISFPRAPDGEPDSLILQKVELHEGALFVAGTVGPSSSGDPDQATPNVTAQTDTPTADQPRVGTAVKETRQE